MIPSRISVCIPTTISSFIFHGTGCNNLEIGPNGLHGPFDQYRHQILAFTSPSPRCNNRVLRVPKLSIKCDSDANLGSFGVGCRTAKFQICVFERNLSFTIMNCTTQRSI